MQSQSASRGRGRRGDSRPSLKELINDVVQAVAVHWRELGFQLLNNSSAQPQDTMNIIEADHSKNGVVRCCEEMFTKWLNIQENASWDQLLEALRSPSIQRIDLASQIEKTLDDANNNHDDKAPGVSSAVIVPTSHDQVDKSMTSEDLEVEFAITTNKIKQALCSSSVNVASVVEQLQTISVVRNKNIPLLDEDVFENVTTVEKLWQKLSRFWSVFDYDMLRILLRIVNCKRTNEIFEEFLSKIDVAAMEDMELVLYYEVFERQGLIKPLLRIKVKAEKCTNYIRRKVEEVVSSKFDLKEYSLCFRGIKEGCIELVYVISNAMMTYLLQCEVTGHDLAEFAAYDIISIHINNMELKIPPEIDMHQKYEWLEVVQVDESDNSSPPTSPTSSVTSITTGTISWLTRNLSYMDGRLTKIKHKRGYELLPENELDESLVKAPLTRDNYVDKFHTLLYYEEHEHARVLKERCDSESLRLSLFQTHYNEMRGSLVGLNSNDVTYVQLAANYVEITSSKISVCAEIINYGVSNKGLDVVNVKFNEDSYYLLKSKITKQMVVSVHFILKHSYFRNLHISLDRINSKVINHLIPSCLHSGKERKLPHTPYPVEDFLWLDKEYQLLALKKMMACDNNAPFLLTGPFGTGKTRVLAAAAIGFLKRPSSRVLICTGHLQAADVYIDKYFGPMTENKTMPHTVNPVRFVGCNYIYSGKYNHMFLSFRNHDQQSLIKRSRLIVTTFLTALQLINIKVRCFTHILIDEDALAREPETIAPLGLADDNTKIVIAGDHLQIGPQILVLGDKLRKSELGRSLLQRFSELYHHVLFENPYTAQLLTNYRCHESISRLPVKLFFESVLLVRAHCKLHPKTSSALQFVCTSMDSSAVVSAKAYNEEEAIIILEQVQHYVDPWPSVQWGNKDLSTVCVIASNRNQATLIMKLLNQSRFRNIRCIQILTTYVLQGLEFRAIFISTLEATKEDGSSLNPTKTICDAYVFNTVITRAQSLVVCVGNPFLLFSIEKQHLNYKSQPVNCWREYVKICLETSCFMLGPQCYESNQLVLQENIVKLYRETFGDLQASLDFPCGSVERLSDNILKAYKQAILSNKVFRNIKITLGNINNGYCGYVLQRSGSHQTADIPILHSSTVGGPIECYLDSTTSRKAIATPLSPSQLPITIYGIDNRRGALDGSLVKVALYKDVGRCGHVCEVLEQGPQQQFVCSVDSNNSIFFCPIDRKSPKLVNLPGLPCQILRKASNLLIIKEELVYKQHAVTVFDPKSFTIIPNKVATNGSIDHEFADIEVPQIKDVIPLSIAQKLLFVVSFLRWNPKYRYPLGVVIAAIPRGLTLYHAQRMLLAHHRINTASVDDVALDDGNFSVVAIDPSLPQYDHALTIDSPEADVFDDALTLERISSKDDGQSNYQLGVHVTNVGRALNRTALEIARERGAAVYGTKTNPLFYPMLHKIIRENLSLDCDRNALAISITCRLFIDGKNIKMDTIKVHESCVCSRAQLTYNDVQELLNGMVKSGSRLDKIVKNYNKMLPAGSGFGIEQKLAVLLQISEYFLRYRMQSDDIDYTIEDDDVLLNPQAHFLVEEMMIWANRIAAEHVLAAFPESTPLLRQPPPRLTKTIKHHKDATDFSPLCKSLALKLGISTEPGLFLMTESLRKQLLGALQSGDITQVSNLLRVTSYHPQLAVLSKEVNGSKLRAQYVCSRSLQEQEKLELQHGDYLVSLTDSQKEVYSHYNHCCLYTHFTSPLRRYIDIVVQRLILQSLSSSPSTEYDSKNICEESNAKVLGAEKFRKEFKCLTLAISLAECSQPCTAYVASAKKYLQLVIRELDWQALSLSQRSFRLSCITGSAKHYNNPIQHLLMGKNTTEGSKSFLWKSRITSLSSDYNMVNRFTNVRKCSSNFKPTQESDAMLTFYLPDQRYTKSQADSSTSHFSTLTQQCYSAEFPNKPLSLNVEEWAKVREFMKQPSEDTALSLKELLMSYNSTKDGDGVKFPTNAASFCLYEVKQSFEAYKCFKMSLAATFSEYILSPCIQLLEVAPMLNVCVQHSTNPASCFSTPVLSDASRMQYNDISEYIDLWEKVLLAEAAVQSVSDDAVVQLIQNVPLKWPTLQQPSTSLDSIHYSPIKQSTSGKEDDGVTLTIDDKFMQCCGEYFDFEVGNLICARYNIPLNEQKEVEGRTVETACAVYHFVIDSISDSAKNYDTNKDSRKKESKKSEVKLSKFVHLKIVSKEASRVSKFMKPYMENPNSLCELQIIPLNLLHRRMYKSLLALKYITANSLCERIALGTAFDKKISARSVRKKTTLIKADSLVFTLWSKPYQNLNVDQCSSLFAAIRNKFQLIQCPPGTGKSVTGAHLAYASIVANTSDLKFVPSSNEKIKCVMYCGASNKSVDVVLDMFLQHPGLKNLRILRIYSKSIDTKHYGLHSSKVHSTFSSDQECEETQEEFALHMKIRSKNCSLSARILQMEEKFERYSKENILPSPSEKHLYDGIIKQAEEEIIRSGKYHIVYCTCNEACSVRVVDNIEPTHLIIDEAAMITEPEAMIPIQLAEHVTLIGDHMQLQPVINHPPAKEKGLGCSLFERYAEILNNDTDMILPTGSMLMLTIQYRMHDKICGFPSLEFYNGKLNTDSSVLQHFCLLKGFWPAGPQCPIAFCDIIGKEEGASSPHHKVHQESKYNRIEADKIVDIIVALRKAKRSNKKEPKIAVLTPYNAQKEVVEDLMSENKLEVTVSTIDESQGSEFDFVIFSTVRSMPRHTIRNRAAVQPDRTWIRDHLGFVTDRHQICIGITRAKHGLVIIGNAMLLSYDPTWERLLDHYKYHECKVEGSTFPSIAS